MVSPRQEDEDAKTLDRTLRELSGYRLQRATSAAMIRYKEVFAEFGLRRTTFSCLSLIIDNPGLKQSQLGETLSIERPNLVSIVEDLTSVGLITRTTSETDRRAYALRPTDKGRTLFAKALAAVQALDSKITSGMSDKSVTELKGALDQVEANAGYRAHMKNAKQKD